MRANESYFYLRDTPIDEIIHPEWGIASFSQLEDELIPMIKMMLRMGKDIVEIDEIPKVLRDKGSQIIDVFYSQIRGLKNFDASRLKTNGFQDQEALVTTIRASIESYLTARITSDNNSAIFLNVYHSIISFESDSNEKQLKIDFENLKKEILIKAVDYEKVTADYNLSKVKYDELIQLLTSKTQEKTTEDYAEIFKAQAKLNRESSIWWLIITIVAIIGFFYFVKHEDDFLSVDLTKNATVTTIEYLKRLLVISFLIYVITFLIKQYNVKKHLETLNIHRQNTLDSYNLFIKSIGTADQDVKNALMVEVARAIYESGQTGYLNTKEEGNSSPSIMEITKFMKPNP